MLWVAVAALVFGTYLAAGYYLAPGLIRSQATAWVKTNLGKPIAIGEIGFNPLGFKLDISDIAIPGPDRPMLAVGHLRVGFSLLSFFQDAWRLSELRIDRPFVGAAILPDGSLNLLELVPKSHDNRPAPALRIDILSVDQGRIAFADLSRPSKPQETLAPITFILRDFHTKSSEGGAFTLDAKSQRGESFAWRGTVSMAPIASRGNFLVGNLQADTIGKFLGGSLPVALTGGRIGLKGSYGFSYGADGMRLTLAVPELLLDAIAFGGRDTLFHGAVQIERVAANLGRFDLSSDSQGRRAMAAVMPRLSLHGVTLSGTGAAQGQTIRLTDAVLDNARLDYASHLVSLGAVTLGGLDLPLARERTGAINLMNLLPAPAASPAEPSPADAAPWNVQLAALTLANGAMHFEDRTVSPAAHFDLAPIALTAAGLGTDLTRPLTLQLDIGINAEGKLKADGTVMPVTRAADLRFSLSGMKLRPAASYLPDAPALDLRSGTLDVAGTLNLSGGEKSALRFKGDASLDNLSLYARAGDKSLLAWRGLRITGIDYGPSGVHIAQARLSRPAGDIAVLPDRSFNFAALMASPAVQPAAAPASAAPLPPHTAPPALSSQPAFRLDRLDIDDGAMGFADYSIDPNFQAQIQALTGSITNITSAPDAIAAIDLKGQIIDQYSPVTIAGTANLFGYDRNTNIQLAFRNIELPIFNPYSGRYAGYAIAKGKLTTLLSYKIVNRALEADHHILIDQLEWGQATDSKDKVPWPVGLVTSLLKDKNGLIDLDLPVKGSLDDPSFRLGPIIWQIIGNLVEKIVVAPFSLIGSLFAGAEKAQFVDFAPGSAALPVGAADSLAALAKGLGDRPALQLDIPAAPAVKEDAVAIADTRVAALVMANEIKKGQPADPAALSPDDRYDRFRALYRSKFGKSPTFPQPLPDATQPAATTNAAAPPDEKLQQQINELHWMQGELRNAFLPSAADLAALGSARATAVRDALLAKGDIDAARVFLVTGQAGAAMNDGVRLELKLR